MLARTNTQLSTLKPDKASLGSYDQTKRFIFFLVAVCFLTFCFDLAEAMAVLLSESSTTSVSEILDRSRILILHSGVCWSDRSKLNFCPTFFDCRAIASEVLFVQSGLCVSMSCDDED